MVRSTDHDDDLYRGVVQDIRRLQRLSVVKVFGDRPRLTLTSLACSRLPCPTSLALPSGDRTRRSGLDSSSHGDTLSMGTIFPRGLRGLIR